MATITQIRGALLEEAVLFLLRKVDYEPYDQTALSLQQSQYMRAGVTSRDNLDVTSQAI